jgi:DNA-binding PadR family transcriptional regulator
MKILSRQEEIILTAICKLQGNAYGMAIREEIVRVTGVNMLFGSIYTPLARLLEKGLVSSHEGEPVPERGGRRKVFYTLTPKGKEELIEIQRLQTAIWADMPSLNTK